MIYSLLLCNYESDLFAQFQFEYFNILVTISWAINFQMAIHAESSSIPNVADSIYIDHSPTSRLQSRSVWHIF